jgi:hypothetical protein
MAPSKFAPCSKLGAELEKNKGEYDTFIASVDIQFSVVNE